MRGYIVIPEKLMYDFDKPSESGKVVNTSKA